MKGVERKMSFKGTSNKNFGGYNPTVYDRSRFNNVQQLRQIAMKDPWFAAGDVIGSALAGAYANNYNNRGISKAVDKALAEYQTPSAADEQAALQQVQQQMLQPGNGSIGVGMSDMDALANVRQNYGLDPMPNVGASIPAGGMPTENPLAQSLKAASDQKREDRIQQNSNPSAYNEAMRVNAVRQQVSNAALPAKTIEQLAQMPGAAIIARENAARSLNNFNAEEALMRAQQQMLKDGRTPYQIEQAMQILNPHFQKMQDDAYKIGAEKIMAELGATDDKGNRVLSDPEYKQRIVDLATQYGDIGKAAANVYGRDIVSGREQWNAQQQNDREARRMAAQMARDNQRYQAQQENTRLRGLYGYGRGTGRTGIAGTGISKDDAKWAEDTIKNLESKLATMREDNPDANLSPEDRQNYNLASRIRAQINQQRAERYGMGSGNAPQRNAGTGKNESTGMVFDRNNYNHQARALLGMIRANKGVLDDKLEGDFRELIGLDRNNTDPNEMTNQVISHLQAYRKAADKDTNVHGGKSGLF